MRQFMTAAAGQVALRRATVSGWQPVAAKIQPQTIHRRRLLDRLLRLRYRSRLRPPLIRFPLALRQLQHHQLGGMHLIQDILLILPAKTF